MYGNIGVPECLEFSVICPADNEVARIEGQTKELDRKVLVSGEFAKNQKIDRVSMGRPQMKGVANPIEVFGIPEKKAGAALHSPQNDRSIMPAREIPDQRQVNDKSTIEAAPVGALLPKKTDRSINRLQSKLDNTTRATS